jgi:alkylation response protein AidB-like acyl-CoA dehydrogenase
LDLDLTAEELSFRDEVRAWLADNVPAEPRPRDGVEAREYDLAWQARQYEGGWAGISWPTEYGGRGLSTIEQLLWYEEYARVGAPDDVNCCFVGNNHGGPTLILHGTDEQKVEHLPKILAGEVVWCQGFSEPGAGSDLASLRTRGEIDGDDLVVNGSKIWSSYADVADHQELLVRTGDGERHKGLTWIICDMDTPGIQVRPIRNMAGENEFCEVFYDDVRIPRANVVGEIGAGWTVAMSTLSFERGTAFAASQVRLAGHVDDLVELARRTPGPDGRPAIEDGAIADRLGRAQAEVTALRAMTWAGVSRTERTGSPGAEGSMTRVMYAELSQRVHALAMDILGPAGLDAERPDGWTHRWLYEFAATIGGGTSQIQREIIAERVLGLPRSR